MSTTFTECKAIGVVEEGSQLALLELLKGLSITPAQKHITQEIILTSKPKDMIPACTIRLIRIVQPQPLQKLGDIPPQNDGCWIMRCEGTRMRSKLADSICGSIFTDVNESVFTADDARGYFTSLGFQQQSDILKDGNQYLCRIGDFNLNVIFVSVRKTDGSWPKSKEMMKLGWVEVSCRPQQDQHLKAAEAIQKFGDSLMPYTKLQKAAI
eukprot:TRINITY_DN12212_c1_g3_i1.p1 TRINITY_DN12212_c1_g3~~TRINITY_DN12212_c1_g3_i1.p1  ORF type:complete len:211 (+),score=35.91 TRINITY_DN12212_c1_g3_i1:145-777(+)